MTGAQEPRNLDDLDPDLLERYVRASKRLSKRGAAYTSRIVRAAIEREQEAIWAEQSRRDSENERDNE